MKLKNVYKAATIDYANLHSGAIQTLAPDAILVTRQYTRPAMIEPQRLFRDCFYAHLDDLKEVPGNHPKWRRVSASNHGTWDWYEIPGETAGSASDPTVPIVRKPPRKRHQAAE